MKSDKEFYGGRIPQGGEEVIFMNGKAYSKVDIDYIKSQSKTKQSPPSKKVDPSDSHINDQRERLTLLKNNRARLQKQIDDMTKVINHIEADLKSH